MAGLRIYRVEAHHGAALAVVARPRCRSAFKDIKDAGIDVLVSLLEPDEAEEVGLHDEAEQCRVAGIELIALPVTDHGTPDDLSRFAEVAATLAGRLEGGTGIGAHCFAGLGRSPMLVAAVLIHLGHDVGEAVDLVSAARGCHVPEMESQHVWLEALARHIGRG